MYKNNDIFVHEPLGDNQKLLLYGHQCQHVNPYGKVLRNETIKNISQLKPPPIQQTPRGLGAFPARKNWTSHLILYGVSKKLYNRFIKKKPKPTHFINIMPKQS